MILVLTTTNDKDIAKKIGNELLNAKLVACYSILPEMESSYWWKGEIRSEKEYQLLLKTTDDNFEKIERTIKKLHNYDLPEVISINIKHVGKDYLKWIEAEIG